jgi:hypothetical protein
MIANGAKTIPPRQSTLSVFAVGRCTELPYLAIGGQAEVDQAGVTAGLAQPVDREGAIL